MLLIDSGLDTALTKFRYLWGRYPYGFKPWTHCLRSLKTNVAKGISKAMKDGPVELEDRLFYLCGVGQNVSEKRHPGLHPGATNVHIAVLPSKGNVIEVGSVYGVTFRIEDAQRIDIAPVPDNFRGLTRDHARCKNFQFGHQMFVDDPAGVISKETVFELRDEWKSVPIEKSVIP